MRRLILPLFVLITSMLVLHACGFKLRGAMDLSSDFSPIYIDQKTAFELVRDIKSLLAANNIEVVDDVTKSRSQLFILNEQKTSRVLSVDTGGQAREYLLNYKVDFAISNKGSAQAPASGQASSTQASSEQARTAVSTKMGETDMLDSVSISRDLLFDIEAVLGFANESALLYKEMRRDAARLIILKLQVYSKDSAVSKTQGSQKASPEIDDVDTVRP